MRAHPVIGRGRERSVLCTPSNARLRGEDFVIRCLGFRIVIAAVSAGGLADRHLREASDDETFLKNLACVGVVGRVERYE